MIRANSCPGQAMSRAELARETTAAHSTIHHMQVRKKWRPQGMSTMMFSFLMDFTFDSCAFHFWSGVGRLI